MGEQALGLWLVTCEQLVKLAQLNVYQLQLVAMTSNLVSTQRKIV